MSDSNQDNKLFVPQGMKAEREYFQGFGRSEIIRTGYAMLVLGVLTVLLYIILRRTIIIVGILIFGTVSIIALVTRSEQSNMSPWDHIVNYILYYKDQQKYYYQQKMEE